MLAKNNATGSNSGRIESLKGFPEQAPLPLAATQEELKAVSSSSSHQYNGTAATQEELKGGSASASQQAEPLEQQLRKN